MTILLWVRTKRRLSTYSPDEIDAFLEVLRSDIGVGAEEPFRGGDQLLIPIGRWYGGIHSLKRVFGRRFEFDNHGLVEDWSLTEVGRGIGPGVEVEFHRDAMGRESCTWDDRFIFSDQLQLEDGPDFEQNDLPFINGIDHLNWRLTYDVERKTGLWVDLTEDLDDNRYLISRFERALPGNVAKLWQGRSSLLFAYLAHHDTEQSNFYGISDAVADLLDDDRVAYWLSFQVGNASVGGIAEGLNQMADFIWRQGRQQGPAGPARLKGPVTPKKTDVVVVKSSRPAVTIPGRPRRAGSR